MHQTAERFENVTFFLSDTKKKQSGLYRLASDTKNDKNAFYRLFSDTKNHFLAFCRLISDTLKKALVITDREYLGVMYVCMHACMHACMNVLECSLKRSDAVGQKKKQIRDPRLTPGGLRLRAAN
jgi:hypothetical protein